MEWPQYVMIAMYVLVMCIRSFSEKPEIVMGTMAGLAFNAWILYMGGFWT